MKQVIILLSLFVAISAQAEVYKYTNKQGKAAYSDVPVTGSEKIKVPPVMTYTAPVTPKFTASKGKADKQPKDFYEYLEITSPLEEGTVRNNQGIVKVSYSLMPKLRRGDRVVLFVDGTAQPSLVAEGVERGAHTLELQILGRDGAKRKSSKRVLFYLHRQSKL